MKRYTVTICGESGALLHEDTVYAEGYLDIHSELQHSERVDTVSSHFFVSDPDDEAECVYCEYAEGHPCHQ